MNNIELNLSEMSIEELNSLSFKISNLIETKIKESVKEVTMEKRKNDILISCNGRTIIVKPVAFAGRNRIYNAIIGKFGRFIPGEIINKETCSNIYDIRNALELNRDLSKLI